MQVWQYARVCVLLTLSQQIVAKSKKDTKRPGICEETKDCMANGYQCVALQTTRSGTDTVKQCLPKVQDTDVCSGQFPGLCPTFSSWASPYNQISSVCTYKPAEKKCVTGTESSTDKGVICVAGAKDSSGETIDAIYGCVDFDTSTLKVLFGEGDATKFSDKLGTTAALTESCLSTNSTSSSTLLCAGQGTCIPDAIGSLNYTCRCNVGYSGAFCDIIDSNKCQLPGQCATGVCNLDMQECECAASTTGNQCSECDPMSEKACNGKGICSNVVCKCEEGWEGLQCTKESAIKNPSKSTSSDTSNIVTSTSSAFQSSRPMYYVIVVVAAAVFLQ